MRTAPFRGGRPRYPFALNLDSPQADRLWAWWPCFDAQGKTVREVVRGQHGTMNASMNWVTDGLGNDPVLSNTNNAGDVNIGSVDLPLGGVFSLSWWMYPVSAWDTELNPVFGAAGSGRFYAFVGLTSANQYTFRATVSASEHVFRSGANIVAHGRWYHFCYVRAGTSGANNRLYVNGAAIPNLESPSSAVTTGATTYYIASNQPGWSARARSCDWRLYTKALTQEEVSHLYMPDTRWDLYAPA